MANVTCFGPSPLTGYGLDLDREDITVGTSFVLNGDDDWSVVGVRIQPAVAVGEPDENDEVVLPAAYLYRTANGTGFGADAERLAVKGFSSALVPNAWNLAVFDEAVPVDVWPAGGNLIAAVYLPSGGYAFKASVFAATLPSVVNPDLVANSKDDGPGNGVFIASGIADPLNPPATLSFNHSTGGTHYGVDVLVRSGSGETAAINLYRDGAWVPAGRRVRTDGAWLS